MKGRQDVVSPGTGVTDHCDLSFECQELNQDALEGQLVILTSYSPSRPLSSAFIILFSYLFIACHWALRKGLLRVYHRASNQQSCEQIEREKIRRQETKECPLFSLSSTSVSTINYKISIIVINVFKIPFLKKEQRVELWFGLEDLSQKSHRCSKGQTEQFNLIAPKECAVGLELMRYMQF